MLIFSCVSMSITSMVIIFSTNVWMYSALKFLIGFWRSSIGTCVLVLLTEKVSAEWRFRVGIVEYFTFTMGYMSLPGFAYINRNSSWKTLYLWSSIPAICYSVIAYLFVNESPRVPAAKVVLAMVAFFGACTAYNVFLIYIIELFPTCVRNTTTSLVRQAIVFGCIFCPFLISAGRKNNIFSYGVFGAVIMLSNFTLFCLPETIGIVLCDTMDQQEKKEIALCDAINQEKTGIASV
ncbi:hypothetical protein TSUD_365310 [Trifolium subterraneum]|uniref:Major facilitator superfamily (MFS) profile domain-containing protein n=1 Tax=Trifolium subterraneum TaxID=3900 RepID=A0A2Z6NM41_TRISU|nr:hypothetical protein TSUD_365310 [Trifolium subterraneum]